MVASIQAVLRVSTREPTDVPKEFATSFAPIPNAKTNETKNPATRIQKDVDSYQRDSISMAVRGRMTIVAATGVVDVDVK
jgi:hypothetical protein